MLRKRNFPRNEFDEDEDEMKKFMKLVDEDEGNYAGFQSVKDKQRKTAEEILRRKMGRIGGEKEIINQDSNNSGEDSDGKQLSSRKITLLDQAAELRKAQAQMDKKVLKQQQQQVSEIALLKEANQVQTNALQSNEEIALGVQYTESLKTTWTAPKYLLDLPESVHENTRKKWHIIVEGEECPPPIKSFKEMKFPNPILEALQKKGISRPTPIQVQGLPALLSGRDIIGIAFTGSGKTLTFSLPLIMFALEEEMNMPLEPGEGPIGLILCPSRELARQTFEVVQHFISVLNQSNYPELRAVLCIGGESKREQVRPIHAKGVHCIVATPGRLNDLLNQGEIHMDLCKYMVLDEGDRMLDLGFDEEVHSIINRYGSPKDTVLTRISIHIIFICLRYCIFPYSDLSNRDKQYCSARPCLRNSKTSPNTL